MAPEVAALWVLLRLAHLAVRVARRNERLAARRRHGEGDDEFRADLLVLRLRAERGARSVRSHRAVQVCWRRRERRRRQHLAAREAAPVLVEAIT